MEIREFYLDLHEELMAPPELQNADGDPLVFHTVRFEIDSAETAFETLCDLCATEDPAELLEAADLDRNGGIVRVEIPWNRVENETATGMSNTLLGMIVIDKKTLSAEVNSARRAETARALIKERLGAGARYQNTMLQDPDAWTPDDYDGEMEPTADTEALMADPAVHRKLAEYLQKHWEGWVNLPLPALRGKTPADAVKTVDGREAVAALIDNAERTAAKDPATENIALEAIGRARKKLGLD